MFLDWELSPHFTLLGDKYLDILQAYIRVVLDLDDKTFIHNIKVIEEDIVDEAQYESCKKFFIDFCNLHDKQVSKMLSENERVLLKYGEVRYEDVPPLYDIGGFIDGCC